MDIGLIGFGGVGQAFIKLLLKKKEYLYEKYKITINLKYIINSTGGIYDSEGINLLELKNYLESGNEISKYLKWGNFNIDTIITNRDVDTIIELTHTNIKNGEPGLTHIRKALINKINVVTGNKGPILLKYKELKELANENKVSLMAGCTTGGALPSINGGVIEVAGSEITYMECILNGTTNYILTEMSDKNISYEEALITAQKLGIAELNPEIDVEGYDTAIKIIILANIILNANLTLKDVKIKGITNVKSEYLKKLKEEGKKLKLIGIIKNDKEVKVEVQLCEIDRNHPLYCVDGKNKGITYKTDSIGDITIIGGASGTENAAAAILRDLINMK